MRNRKYTNSPVLNKYKNTSSLKTSLTFPLPLQTMEKGQMVTDLFCALMSNTLHDLFKILAWHEIKVQRCTFYGTGVHTNTLHMKVNSCWLHNNVCDTSSDIWRCFYTQYMTYRIRIRSLCVIFKKIRRVFVVQDWVPFKNVTSNCCTLQCSHGTTQTRPSVISHRVWSSLKHLHIT